MNCDDVRNALYVYLDGEFAAPEATAFEEHLETCGSCKTIVEQERVFLTAFRAKLGEVSVPSGLEQRVRLALAEQGASGSAGKRRRQVSGIRLLAMTAAAMLVVVTGAAVISGFDRQGNGGQAAIATHQRDLPMEVRGSTDQVRAFLQENVPFSVEIPYEGADDMELTGARLINWNGRSAVLFNYDMNGRRVSVIQTGATPEERDLANRPPIIEDIQGYRVVTYRTRGLTHSVVGDFKYSDMNRIVPASFVRR
jgi:anti-sigma factor (TIGR02949 family)